MTRVRWCHQRALATRPGVAGKKKLEDSHRSQRASSPAGWTGTLPRWMSMSPWLDVRAERLGRRWRRGGHEDRGPWMSPAGIDERAGSGRQEKTCRLLPLPEDVCSCWWGRRVGRWPETPSMVQQGRGTRWTQRQSKKTTQENQGSGVCEEEEGVRQTWLEGRSKVEEPVRGSSDPSGCGLEVSAGSRLGPYQPSLQFGPGVGETSPGRFRQASPAPTAASVRDRHGKRHACSRSTTSAVSRVLGRGCHWTYQATQASAVPSQR
ncbi:hypothetical protein HPB51_005682 [Rhipicephalus microplus]|uniref:Uncharacterized protein n=1 Tax=Rhipicephalus microplus TaxID=6941 RepID=A0A9J6EZC7_RHIMP|nr:hypothetical protein HPB51_005682 [Rhipicephalus microplus]